MKKIKALSVLEAARYLRFTRAYIYRLAYLGKLKCYKPSGGRLYFKKSDLDKYFFSNVRQVRAGKNKTTVDGNGRKGKE